MKATVKSVQANGTWESNGKTFHKFEIQIGEHLGEYSTNKFTDKDADDFPFKEGQEAEYEFVAHEKYPKIKLPFKEYKGKQTGSNASFALSYSKDLHVAAIGDSGVVPSSDTVTDYATELLKWLNNN